MDGSSFSDAAVTAVQPDRDDAVSAPTLRDDLLAVHALLSPAGAWCQGHLAVDRLGHPLAIATDEAARSWCLLGAVSKVARGVHENRRWLELWGALNQALPEAVSLEWWNDRDGRTQAEVLDLVLQAAEKATVWVKVRK